MQRGRASGCTNPLPLLALYLAYSPTHLIVEALPQEILDMILLHIPVSESLVHCFLTCKRLRSVGMAEHCWAVRCRNDLGDMMGELPSGRSWLETYKDGALGAV